MNQRFAQILADATDPYTGKVDRNKLFEALSVDASDPLAMIFDAAGYTGEAAGLFAKRLVEITKNLEVSQKGLATVLRENASAIEQEGKTLSGVVSQASQAVHPELIADQISRALAPKLAKINFDAAEAQVDRVSEKLKLANKAIDWSACLIPAVISLFIVATGWVLAWFWSDGRIKTMAEQVKEYPEISRALNEHGIYMGLGTGDNEKIPVIYFQGGSVGTPYISTKGNSAVPLVK